MNREEPINPFVREDIVRLLCENAPPRRVEIVPSTGELFSNDALALARLYERLPRKQQKALEALAAALQSDAIESGESR